MRMSNISLCVQVMPQATECKYRVVKVPSSGGIHDEIAERTDKHSRQLHMLYPTSKEKHLSTEIKRLIYKLW